VADCLPSSTTPPSPTRPWWHTAAVYQLYLRSFADSNGDGVGDLGGVLAHLDHLERLGVDAIWFNPWFPSPMADGGYDVSDYRDIAPEFGSLQAAEALIEAAHARDIRVIIDIVPNHCSSEHRWFQEALAAGPGSAARSRFWCRPGRGTAGELPPNNWLSMFGGPAWTRVKEADGTPGEWYLHLFAPEQPDFNWDSEAVRREFEEVLEFWLDRGIDGIRIDSAALLVKDAGLPDLTEGDPHPYIDVAGVHDVYRSWRRLADRYPGDRVLIGELWLDDRDAFDRYLRPDELHTAFDFDFLCCAWEAAAIQAAVDRSRAMATPTPTWVLSNHDVVRNVTRYGRDDTSFSLDHRQLGAPVDFELGTMRSRAAALMVAALPGSVYVYQGEELGLWEVEDLPEDVLADPIWWRSQYTVRGRDGCRVPIPWAGDKPPFGFSAGADPWLPQPADWGRVTVAAEDAEPTSMLALYRAALNCRRLLPELRGEDFQWIDAEPEVLAFRRGAQVVCLVNFSDRPVVLPAGSIILASAPLIDGQLPAYGAAWVRTDG
jgi:alpha-glucosidase